MNMSEKTKQEQLRKFIFDSTGVTTSLLEEICAWESVRAHCLIEAARVSVFGDMLGFDKGLLRDSVTAALLHDGNKEQEVAEIEKAIRMGDSGRAASVAAAAKYMEKLKSKKVSSRTVNFIHLVGGMPETLIEIKKILNKKSLNSEDLAALVVHYVDDYTRNDEWVLSAERQDGKIINDVDRRAEKNRTSPRYEKIYREITEIIRAHPFFAGMTSLQAAIAVSHEIEEKIALMLEVRSGTRIAPCDIPEEVERKIKGVNIFMGDEKVANP